MSKKRKSHSTLPFLLILFALAAVLFFAFAVTHIEKSATNADTTPPQTVVQNTEASKPHSTKLPTLPENSPLFFGNPSAAKSNAQDKTNYLMEKQTYTLSYNEHLHTPLWVAWHLSYSDLGTRRRSNSFTADKALPAQYFQVSPKDYNFLRYGFDRGHLCPSGDRTRGASENSETFLMTNMLPQCAKCNRGVWKDFEEYCRKLTKSGNELYITAGPYGSGGTSAKGTFSAIEVTTDDERVLSINVPSYCWKVALVLSEGDDDFSRVTQNSRTIAVFIPNSDDAIGKARWQSFLVTVDEVEEKTGLDFFCDLDDDIENLIEARLWKD